MAFCCLGAAMDMNGLGDGVCSRAVARLQQVDVMQRISVVTFLLGAAAGIWLTQDLVVAFIAWLYHWSKV